MSLKKKFSLSGLTDKLASMTTSSKSSFAEPISPSEEETEHVKREAKTKAKYPVHMDLSRFQDDLSLEEAHLEFVGAGLRSERVVGIEFWIYTIGLYVDMPKAKRALQGCKGFGTIEAGEAHESDAFCEALIRLDGASRVLRFVITLAGLTASLVVGQFDKVLLPKMKARGEEAQYRFIMENIGKAKLKKGTEMLLVLSADGTVGCVCDGELLGTVKCKALCEAIMEIYFPCDGDKPISADVKEKVCNGLLDAITRRDA